MPSRTLVHCGEKHAMNFKKAKDRVTLLACANVTCKLPLMFIHKSKNPRCFKHMDMNNLPVHYYCQKKAWMDTKLFETWFYHRFVMLVGNKLSSSPSYLPLDNIHFLCNDVFSFSAFLDCPLICTWVI